MCEINNNKPTPLEIRAILNKFLRFHPVFVHVKYTYNMAACYMNVVTVHHACLYRRSVPSPLYHYVWRDGRHETVSLAVFECVIFRQPVSHIRLEKQKEQRSARSPKTVNGVDGLPVVSVM